MDHIDSRLAQAITEHFLTWSGGVPPESRSEVTVYVDYARRSSWDPDAVTRFLIEWMCAPEEWLA